MKSTVLLLTCEHALNVVPDEYQHLFEGQDSCLNSPHAYAQGAHDLATHISQELNCLYIHTPVTRLMMDAHVSPQHKNFFSSFTQTLSAQEHQHLINTYYLPFYNTTYEHMCTQIREGQQVLHVSVHSFEQATKKLFNHTALKLLYDLRRHGEGEVVRLWKRILSEQDPSYRVRINAPYSNAHTHIPSQWRALHQESEYLHITLALNQKLLHNTSYPHEVKHAITTSLTELMQIL